MKLSTVWQYNWSFFWDNADKSLWDFELKEAHVSSSFAKVFASATIPLQRRKHLLYAHLGMDWKHCTYFYTILLSTWKPTHLFCNLRIWKMYFHNTVAPRKYRPSQLRIPPNSSQHFFFDKNGITWSYLGTCLAHKAKNDFAPTHWIQLGPFLPSGLARGRGRHWKGRPLGDVHRKTPRGGVFG